MKMIIIDGSHGEGGGAILRYALALSVLTNRPFKMTNIRSNRPTKGLKHEHLGVINIMKELCKAKVSDAFLESEEIIFIPGEIKNKNINYEFKTAASSTLVCQSLLLASLFSKKKVKFTIVGGTDVKWSIPSDYFNNVLVRLINDLELGKVDFKVLRRGYFPKGQGIVELSVKSHYSIVDNDIPKINLSERGRVMNIFGHSNASIELEKASVSLRQKESAENIIKNFLKSKNQEFNENFENVNFKIDMSYSNTSSPGSIITLWAKTKKSIIGADCLGEKGKQSEKVGEEAAKKIVSLLEQDVGVDSYLADQLIPYLAICKGIIKTDKITDHLKSNIYVTKLFYDVEFIIDEENKTIEVK